MSIKKYLSDLEAKNPESAANAKRDLAFQVGREIERNRVTRDVTQAQLAEAIGTKQSGISRLERGSALPSLTTLKKIADFFGTYVELRFRELHPVARSLNIVNETANGPEIGSLTLSYDSGITSLPVSFYLEKSAVAARSSSISNVMALSE